MGFPRQEYWSGLLFPSQGNFSNPGIKPTSPLWDMFSSGLKYKAVFIPADLKATATIPDFPRDKADILFSTSLTPGAISMDFELGWALWVLSEDP